MSRIHDALKKAEQERGAAHHASDTMTLPVETALVGAVAASSTPSGITDTSTRSDMVPSAASSARLGFDAIVAGCAHSEWRPEPNANVFLNPTAGAHGAEQFRTLRSRLYQLRGNQPSYALLVTSSLPDEGKTFVVNNLAQAIVQQANRRALVIDADLRYSQLHLAIGASQAPGLADYLRGEADERAIIQRGKAENLCCIAGGSQVTNPSELLSNGRLKVLLDRLTPIFDWVIFDSPPCIPVADASMLAGLCNGVLLVVRAGSTPTELAQKTCQDLEGKNMIGVVLNGMEQNHLYGSYPYAYGYGKNGSQRPQE